MFHTEVDIVSDAISQHVTDLSGRETLVRITGKSISTFCNPLVDPS